MAKEKGVSRDLLEEVEGVIDPEYVDTRQSWQLGKDGNARPEKKDNHIIVALIELIIDVMDIEEDRYRPPNRKLPDSYLNFYPL